MKIKEKYIRKLRKKMKQVADAGYSTKQSVWNTTEERVEPTFKTMKKIVNGYNKVFGENISVLDFFNEE